MENNKCIYYSKYKFTFGAAVAQSVGMGKPFVSLCGCISGKMYVKNLSLFYFLLLLLSDCLITAKL